MNNFIKIIPARAGHCTANYNLLFSPGMTDFDEFIHKNLTLTFGLVFQLHALNRQR